jgi:pimeloyl-ACP methyl ester carboxylesterase
VLARRGFEDVTVVELPRWEWIRVAGGLFEVNFWLNRQRPESLAYGWYVERARRTILAASERCGGARVLVVGHSAGGWLARAVLGQGTWEMTSEDAEPTSVDARSAVCGLVTLGAPHFPPPAGSPPCATRGALACCDEEMPGAHLASSGTPTAPGIAYVTVAGVRGGRANTERRVTAACARSA